MTETPVLVVLGATSAIAQAYLRRVASANRFARLILVARDAEKLDLVRADLTARGAAEVSSRVAELGRPSEVPALFEEIVKDAGEVDVCLVAYGELGVLDVLQSDSRALTDLLTVNLVSVAVWLELLAAQFERQGRGQGVAIGSVAGDRGRQSNYHYGASKAGVERLCEGLSHRFTGEKDISFTCVKPGLVVSPMTAHLNPSGRLWTSPETVARSIEKAVKHKRVRVYAPWFWRYILAVVRALPVPVFHRTRL